MGANSSYKYPIPLFGVSAKKVARVFLLAFIAVASHCDIISPTSPTVGRPSGPYTVTLELKPPRHFPGQAAILKFRISHSKTGKPVHDLQILHERALHTFIVNEDLSTFAHTHHEDYKALDLHTLESAEFEFPYEFLRISRLFGFHK